MSSPPVQPHPRPALWREFTNDVELQRLALLDERITRKQQILEHSMAERQRIMARAIRRMRRAAGKS